MSLPEVAKALQDLSFPTAIRESAYLFPVIETVHVFAIALVVGSIATVDLRLLGWVRRDQAAWTIARQALPWTWTAFVAAVISGGLLFASSAVKYADNGPFRLKLILLLLAGMNMAAFHVGAGKALADWPQHRTPTGGKLAGGLSLLFWVSIIAAGRWIGFTAFAGPS